VATFVLVPGAWLGAWAWDAVVPALRESGHEVIAVTLSGLGDRVDEASPGVGLTTHIRDLVRLVEANDVHAGVLVGHSYAGLVVSGAAPVATGRIARLVFLDASLPVPGLSLLDSLFHDEREELLGSVADGWRIPPPAGLGARAVDQPLRTFQERLDLDAASLEAQRPVYLHCVAGRRPESIARRRTEVARLGWAYRVLATGHWPMLEDPGGLAAALAELA
jgi:pimeloyl-ACP methyl ester carboxylesterase